jgi:hypothetical protein
VASNITLGYRSRLRSCCAVNNAVKELLWLYMKRAIFYMTGAISNSTIGESLEGQAQLITKTDISKSRKSWGEVYKGPL